MATQLNFLKITYADCEDKIWRLAAVSSNYTLAQLGYLVLATFETMAYHPFEMNYKDTAYVLTVDDFLCDEKKRTELLGFTKLGKLGMHAGDVIEMTYDFGCCQTFEITFLKNMEMPRGSGRVFPVILDGAGRGIVDDLPSDELLKAIRKIDRGGHSEIYYSPLELGDIPEWDYRDYSLRNDNVVLKETIKRIREGYESDD